MILPKAVLHGEINNSIIRKKTVQPLKWLGCFFEKSACKDFKFMVD